MDDNPLSPGIKEGESVESTGSAQSTSNKSPVNAKQETVSKALSANSITSKGNGPFSKVFANLNPRTMKMTSSVKDIADLTKKRKELKSAIAELKLEIKPVSRRESKLSSLENKKAPVSPERKKLIKAQLEFYSSELVALEDQIDAMKNELRETAEKAKRDFREQILRNKAQSRYYIKRNRWSIEARLLKTLNSAITGGYLDQINNLRQLSAVETDEGKKKFNDALSQFLFEIDAEIYILCSYELKKPLYEAIRLTLKAWDNAATNSIDSLEFPKES